MKTLESSLYTTQNIFKLHSEGQSILKNLQKTKISQKHTFHIEEIHEKAISESIESNKCLPNEMVNTDVKFMENDKIKMDELFLIIALQNHEISTMRSKDYKELENSPAISPKSPIHIIENRTPKVLEDYTSFISTEEKKDVIYKKIAYNENISIESDFLQIIIMKASSQNKTKNFKKLEMNLTNICNSEIIVKNIEFKSSKSILIFNVIFIHIFNRCPTPIRLQ